MYSFSDASLRGGIPKTKMKMKQYITPNTECQAFLQGGILCHSQDGQGMLGGEGSPSGGSNAAPKKVF
jgi:hypothetical protein